MEYASELLAIQQDSLNRPPAFLATALETCHDVTRIAFCAADVFRCSSQGEQDVSFWFTGKCLKLWYLAGLSQRHSGRAAQKSTGGRGTS